MSDWIDAEKTTSCARPDEKGCLVGAIFFGIMMILAIIIMCLIVFAPSY